jgi:hypothetical protein
MDIRTHVRSFALGTGLALSVLGMPALHALAMGPAGTMPATPLTPPSVSVPAKAFPFNGVPGLTRPSVDYCDAMAYAYNDYVQQAAKAYSTGDVAAGNSDIQLAAQAENQALDEGCAWID